MKNLLLFFSVIFTLQAYAWNDLPEMWYPCAGPEVRYLQIQHERPLPGPEIKYTLVDIGETDVAEELLSRYALPFSYAPLINNLGQVVYQRKEQGYVRGRGELTPMIDNRFRGRFFGINNKEDILVYFPRHSGSDEWLIWKLDDTRKRCSKRIDLGDLQDAEISLKEINDQKIAVGVASIGHKLRPIIWSPRYGLKNLSFFVQWDIEGTALDINKNGTVLGYIFNCEDNPPYVWNQCWGMNSLRNYSWTFQTEIHRRLNGTPLRFADMAIADDDTVYGTLWVVECESPESRFYYGFQWFPKKDEFHVLDLNNMRINAVNSSHTLVGSVGGKAAFASKYFKPTLLETVLGEQAKDWELIAITDINQLGQMVGYGLYKGAMRVFLVDRHPLQVQPKNVGPN